MKTVGIVFLCLQEFSVVPDLLSLAEAQDIFRSVSLREVREEFSESGDDLTFDEFEEVAGRVALAAFARPPWTEMFTSPEAKVGLGFFLCVLPSLSLCVDIHSRHISHHLPVFPPLFVAGLVLSDWFHLRVDALRFSFMRDVFCWDEACWNSPIFLGPVSLCVHVTGCVSFALALCRWRACSSAWTCTLPTISRIV